MQIRNIAYGKILVADQYDWSVWWKNSNTVVTLDHGGYGKEAELDLPEFLLTFSDAVFAPIIVELMKLRPNK